MSKVTMSTYSKKEFLALIERTMKDGDVVVFSNGVKETKIVNKFKMANITIQFPHEMFAVPDDIRSYLFGNIVGTIIIVKEPEKKLSPMYLEGLKQNDGAFGFTLEQ